LVSSSRDFGVEQFFRADDFRADDFRADDPSPFGIATVRKHLTNSCLLTMTHLFA
jgi:hypothetical protein